MSKAKRPATPRGAGGLPRLRDVEAEQYQGLLLQKLALCTIVHQFRDPEKELPDPAKEAKRHTLLELVDVVDVKNAIDSKHFGAVADMLRENLFRPLPAWCEVDWEETNDDEGPALEPAWPHLQIVYEFLLLFVVRADPKEAKSVIDRPFISSLVQLIRTQDPRERDYIKTILHRIYGKFMSLRPFIRRMIYNQFFVYMYEQTTRAQETGIAELLEILGSIINGFTMPLKDEHKSFLLRALVPLYRPRHIESYVDMLSYCVTQFVEKEAGLAKPVILGMLAGWPKLNASKALVLLRELEQLLQRAPPEDYEEVCVPLFRRLSACITSEHANLAERALFLSQSHAVAQLAQSCGKLVVPIMYDALHHHTPLLGAGEERRGASDAPHWHQAVAALVMDARRTLMELDGELFEAAATDQSAKQRERARREAAGLGTSGEDAWAAIRSSLDDDHDKADRDKTDTDDEEKEGEGEQSSQGAEEGASVPLAVTVPEEAAKLKQLMPGLMQQQLGVVEQQPIGVPVQAAVAGPEEGTGAQPPPQERVTVLTV